MSGQFIAERMAGLEATVAALKDSNKELQKLYSEAFYKEKESEREISKLKKKIEEMQDHRRSVPPFAPPFGTPDQVPAWIPVTPLELLPCHLVVGASLLAPLLVLVWVPAGWHQGK